MQTLEYSLTPWKHPTLLRA